MSARAASIPPGGVTIVPDPPQPGAEIEVTVDNGADKISWRIPPDGEDHEVDASGGKAKITVPQGTGGREISISAGEPPDIVSDRFDIVEP